MTTPSRATSGNRLRIVFFGSGAFGLPTLQHLAQNHEVLAVITQPDKPAGRKRVPTPTPIGQWAAEHLPGAELIKPQNVNEPGILERVRAFDVGTEAERRGAWVVIAFGQKLSTPLLADRFAINLHASLLPRWRGAAPINHAILAGDSVTGNSVITLADRMDAGLVLGQSERSIGPSVTAGELHDRLADDGPDLVSSVLADYSAGNLSPSTQDEAAVTLAGKLHKSTGYIDLSTITAEHARRRIHGLNPWPGVTVLFRNEPLKLHRVEVATGRSTQKPGCFEDPKQGLLATADGTMLRLIEVQPAGKRPMPFEAFANGTGIERGEILAPFQAAEAR
ncbi:MAG: methionyl-tRNA formyltransferase [Phycisphaerales bacterium JB065]